MKKFFAAIVLAVFALVGCDTGSSAGPNDDPAVESSSSSSSVEQGSSSIEKKKKKKSSSSVETPNSSSSELSEFSSSSADEVESSSSETLATPCKTETEDNCEYGTLLDERDGQEYKTVKIGDQWWMAENLNYETDNSFCYNDSAEYCEKYGRLYTWVAAMDSVGTWTTNGKGCGYNKTCSSTYPVRGVCPEGWHLPSTTEFETLFTAVGGSFTAGAKLKSQTGWTAYDGITNEDTFGFSALPAGYRGDSGNYYYEGNYAYFWSSTESSSYYAYYVYLYYLNDSAHLYNYYKYDGHSVRCVKD
ncbi:MAG: fibrobacter succinogenes major paralogous domain-containing protein [Fibrobacter sp.]|nr:fibrobacter succinogenes major paralogous domain-containing protein [Fibrobacter sp.]